MQRYFIELAYKGTNYHGWQRQPKHLSVQEAIEQAMGMILRSPDLEIMGCGRTDSGVHASKYYAHFDFAGEFPPGFVPRLNKVLGKDIAIYRIFPVDAERHARFDANRRAYAYHLGWRKDPFLQDTCFYYYRGQELDRKRLQTAANLLLDYDAFLPFCKTGSDAKTMHCQLFRSEWEFRETEYIYHVAANRFLRGMVRLIVGMCVNVAEDKLALDDVKQALDQQTALPKSLSIAPEGLFLTEVDYPWL